MSDTRGISVICTISVSSSASVTSAEIHLQQKNVKANSFFARTRKSNTPASEIITRLTAKTVFKQISFQNYSVRLSCMSFRNKKKWCSIRAAKTATTSWSLEYSLFLSYRTRWNVQRSGPMETNMLREANENRALAKHVFTSKYCLHRCPHLSAVIHPTAK